MIIQIALTLFLGLISCPKSFSISDADVKSEDADGVVDRVPSLQILALAACDVKETKGFAGHHAIKDAQKEAIPIEVSAK